MLCLLYGPALTTVCDHWEDYSLDYTDLCQQSNVCFSTHCLGFSQLSHQEAIIFWFPGCHVLLGTLWVRTKHCPQLTQGSSVSWARMEWSNLHLRKGGSLMWPVKVTLLPSPPGPAFTQSPHHRPGTIIHPPSQPTDCLKCHLPQCPSWSCGGQCPHPCQALG